MGDTKEAILTTALQLFAGNGYEAVSVSQIAGALGMTKGALYKHYKNKRDIFDHILLRMEQRDAEQAGGCEMPEGTLEEMKERYQDISMEQFFTYCKEQFTYWTENTFAASFRRMLTLEQFRSEEMQKLYQQYLVAGHEWSMWQICLHHQESGMQGLRRFVCMQQCSFFTVFMTEQRIRKVQRSNSKRR